MINRLEDYLESNIIRHYGNPLAGVLIPLFHIKNRPYILLTERSSNLRKHSGQISFPGGKIEPEDLSIVDTALRETKEEIGLDESQITIIGHFNDFATPHYTAVSPIIGTFEYPQDFMIQEEEIERIIKVPIDELLNPNIHRTEKWEHEGKYYTIHFFDWKDSENVSHNIWGATAGVIYELLEVIAPVKTSKI